MCQLYKYKVRFLSADGQIHERYGIVAAKSVFDVPVQLEEEYNNVDSIEIHQISCAPYEITEKVYNLL